MTQNSQNWVKYKDKLFDLTHVSHIYFDWDAKNETYEITFFWKDGGGSSMEFTAEEKEKAENIFKFISERLGTIDLEAENETFELGKGFGV